MKRARSEAAPMPSPTPTGRELVVVMESHVSATAHVAKIVEDASGTIEPLFGPSQALTAGTAQDELLRQMARYYQVHAPDDDLDSLAAVLAQQPHVDSAYVKPPEELAAYGNAVDESRITTTTYSRTPDFTDRQVHLNAAPDGINARYAWTLTGGTGETVNIVDVEGAWLFDHEDLLDKQRGIIGGTPPDDLSWRAHGTAVIGIFGGDRNGFGITGICPDAITLAHSVFPGIGAPRAVRNAADLLNPGDIILIELHRPGPRYNFQVRQDQRGYIAVEWWPDDFLAISHATRRGIIVVECAGNGAENLDDTLYDAPAEDFPASWINPFRRLRDCGAIIVGAGAPPPGTHGRDHGPDRSRLAYSNYGSCLDAQGWGQEVASCGYGDMHQGPEGRRYTERCGGTSSAAPIVAGTIACIQGALTAANRWRLTPSEARGLLGVTGSPQRPAPGRPVSQRIGTRPDLREALTALRLRG